jgi:hypothetical protein
MTNTSQQDRPDTSEIESRVADAQLELARLREICRQTEDLIAAAKELLAKETSHPD